MEPNVRQKLEAFSAKYPHFPDGRIDYSHTDAAAAVVVFVMHQDKLLLLKRSDKVRAYKNKWDVIAGYYDEMVEPQAKALEELREEAGILPEDIESMRVGAMVEKHDPDFGSTWYDVPILTILKTQKEITLDFEHTEYAWVTFDQLKMYDLALPFSDDFQELFQ